MQRRIIPKPSPKPTPPPQMIPPAVPKAIPSTSPIQKSPPAKSLPASSSITQAKIDQRHEDIQQLTTDYILDLMNETEASFEDMGFDVNELDHIIDEIEAILYAHSILIYHPATYEDPVTGEISVVDSLYE